VVSRRRGPSGWGGGENNRSDQLSLFHLRRAPGKSRGDIGEGKQTWVLERNKREGEGLSIEDPLTKTHHEPCRSICSMERKKSQAEERKPKDRSTSRKFSRMLNCMMERERGSVSVSVELNGKGVT